MYIPIRHIARREFARFCPEAASVLAQTRRWDDADQKRREIVSASGLVLSAKWLFDVKERFCGGLPT
jgi:hypothetical protein